MTIPVVEPKQNVFVTCKMGVRVKDNVCVEHFFLLAEEIPRSPDFVILLSALGMTWSDAHARAMEWTLSHHPWIFKLPKYQAPATETSP